MSPIQHSIVQLYSVFSRYKRPKKLAELTIFDFGPTDNEIKAVSKPLANISVEVIRSMEFYGRGWMTWGTKPEVCYFLPRILECVAADLNLVDYPSTFGLFKYKLKGSLSPDATEWTPEEYQTLHTFFVALLAREISQLFSILDADSYLQRFDVYINTGLLVRYVGICLMMGLSEQEMIQTWRSTGTLHVNAIAVFLDALEFDCASGLLEEELMSWKAQKQVPPLEELQASTIHLRYLDFIPEATWWRFIYALFEGYCHDDTP